MVYSCFQCSYYTTNKSNFNKHKLTLKHLNCNTNNGGENAKSCFFYSKNSKLLNFTHFDCSYCGKEFKRKYNYERHLSTCKCKSNDMLLMKSEIE